MCECKVGIPLEWSREIVPHLEMKWETRGFSQVVARTSEFLCSFDRYLGEWLELS